MKKRINKILIMAICTLILLSGCGSFTVQTDEKEASNHSADNQVPPWFKRVRSYGDWIEWCDTETRVHYITYSYYHSKGFTGGITVRYNTDGTPYTCKEDELITNE